MNSRDNYTKQCIYGKEGLGYCKMSECNLNPKDCKTARALDKSVIANVLGRLEKVVTS